MSRAKTRNILVLCHLWLAGILAPMFLLVATTGGLYLVGEKGEVAESDIEIPAGLVIDQDAASIEDDVRAVIAANEIDVEFETLRMRPGSITTRPTTQDFVVLSESDGTWIATYNQPNFLYRMIELHKGHGPATFKIYQIIAAISLLLIVFGGLAVGLLAPAYRRATGVALAGGTSLFAVLAFVL